MSKEFKKMMSRKMGGRRVRNFTCPHCRGFVTSKEGSHHWFKARVDKKKLPFSYKSMPPRINKDPKFAKLSIEQFEKKYL